MTEGINSLIRGNENISSNSMSAEDRAFVERRTAADIIKTRKKDCIKCIYLKGANGSTLNTSPRSATNTFCDYLAMEGRRRPCRPGECREAGVFSPRSRRGHKLSEKVGDEF